VDGFGFQFAQVIDCVIIHRKLGFRMA
jgi:hypothetical protein